MPGHPPLDAHAHVLPDIDPRELRALGSAVFAMTREPREWAAATARRDELCAWGLGCHPKVKSAIEDFDVERLAELAASVPLIGEVGLDGGSSVPMAEQRRVFRGALEVARERSRLVSIHSVRATKDVLDDLEGAGGLRGAILHWWRGSQSETERAIALGCCFSLNGAEAIRPKVISTLPAERVLTETDYPHTRRSDRAADRPGAVATIERALADAWGMSSDDVRRQLWRNLAGLCVATRTTALMPRRLQASLLTAL
jgi:TatD DNase family protein